MCIVIDTNTISCVFNHSNNCHDEFEPVENWILKRDGKIVIGGNTYMGELKKMSEYLKFFTHLKTKGKVVILNDDEVDEHEKKIKSMIKDSKCNDQHIIAIIAVSKCKVVCSKDKESFDFIQNQSLYPPGVKYPKIYSNKKYCEHLLVSDNIIQICRECS